MIAAFLLVHSVLRWFLLVVGLAGIAFTSAARLRGRAPGKPEHRVGASFLAALDTEWLVGVVLLILTWGDGTVSGRLVHAVIMTAAVAMAHVLRVRARKADPAGRATLFALVFLVPLVIIGIGHLFLPQG